MFHSLAVNYKMLSSNNQCIYSQYKIYVEKYYLLKKMIKDLRSQNKSMEKELRELKKELNKNISNDNNDVIIEINDNYIDDDYILNIEYDNDDKYELV